MHQSTSSGKALSLAFLLVTALIFQSFPVMPGSPVFASPGRRELETAAAKKDATTDAESKERTGSSFGGQDMVPLSPPADLNGQLWYVTEGNADGAAPHGDDFSDARLVYINDNGSNQTTLVDNTPTVDLSTGFPAEVALDTAAGLYYLLAGGGQGVNEKLLMGHIGSAAAPTVVFTFDPTFAGTEHNLAFGLHLDPINEKIYVGYIEFDPFFDNAHQGLRRFDYNPTTGAVSGGAYIVTQTTANIQPSTAGATALFAARDLDIDYPHNKLYATVLALGDGFETNTLVRFDLAAPGVATALINQTFFALNGDGSDFPTCPNGIIIDAEVDQASDRVFFSTHQENVGGVHHEDDAIWVIPSASTASGVTPSQVTLSGIPTPLLFYPDDIVLDEVNDLLYVESEQTDTSGPSDDIILVFHLTSNTAATLVNTITPAPFNGVVNIQGMAFDELAVLASVNGTATHPVEQSAAVTLLTGAPTITDFESDHIANATVQITGGTFVSNETSANDDHLTVNGQIAGLVAGTNITVSWTAATETLALTGYDTLANYQTVLSQVQYFTTGDNPTNYGNNTTRTISWQANDGAAGNPSGTANVAPTNLRTTSITIDAVNDAPVNAFPVAQVVNEDTNLSIPSLSVSDVDANPASQQLTTTLAVVNGTLTVLPAGGAGVSGSGTATVTLTGTKNQIVTTLSAANNVVYRGVQDYFGPDTLTFTTNDQGNTGIDPGLTGTATTEQDQDAIGITVNPINDEPTLAAISNPADILEDAAQQTVNLSGVSEGPSNESSQTLTVTASSNNTGLITNPVTVSFVEGNTTGSLSYTPVANANGSAIITVTVMDSGGTANPGDDNTVQRTFTVNVTAVNDAPVLDASKIPTLTAETEDVGGPIGAVGTLVSGLVDFATPAGQVDNVTEVDSGALLGIAITATDTANGTWFYSVNSGGVWSPVGAVSSTSALLLAADVGTRLYFQPNANFNGTLSTAITFQAWDRTSGTAGSVADASVNGGTTAFSTVTDTAALTVTAVNDAPVLDAAQSPTLTAIDEDNLTSAGDSIASIVVDGSVTDVDGPPVEAVAVTSVDNTNGKWQFSTNNGGAWTDFSGTTGAVVSFPATARLLDGTLAGASTHKIRFVPNANRNGASSLTIRAWDKTTGTAGNTADTTTNGGTTAYSTATDTVRIAINAVNDAPSFIKGADQAVPIDFGARTVSGWATAISEGPADELAQTLTFNVTGNTNPGLFSVSPAISPTTGTLTFTTQSGASGTTTITLTLSDDGSNTPPNVNTSAAQTFTIQVGPTASNSSISGHITDANGDPLGGVVVGLSNGRRTITRADGNYQFDEVPTGELYTLTPMLANHSFTPHTRSFSLVGNMTDAAFAGAADGSQPANPLDTDMYFVRQQYLDFLGREPDEGGLQFWTAQVNGGCVPNDTQCLNNRRVDAAAAFFMSAEFQASSSYIYDLYYGALGRQPAFAEYSADKQHVVGGANLDADKDTFARSFVVRPEFVAKYQAATTADLFVDALIQNVHLVSGVDLNSQRDSLIARYNTGIDQTESRGFVVRDVADNAAFRQSQYNRAFVLTEYFGYLQRDPEAGGYAFWLDVLNNGGAGNYRGMVCAFVTSTEYQHRFSTVITHSNAECGP